MPFNSYQFTFAFLPIVLVVYWALVQREMRKSASYWLLLVSVYFYATASLKGLAIIGCSLLVDFAVARRMLRLLPSDQTVRKFLVTLGIVIDVAVLGYLKYRNFFFDTVNEVFSTHLALTQTLLPIGISFLTFQKIAFLSDVYSRQVKAVSAPDFFLFSLYFPRATLGPIVRFKEVVPQFAKVNSATMKADIAVGACLFAIGLFKKVVVADNLIDFVSPVFDAPMWYSDSPPALTTAWSGVLAYILQLYFDFSGYSDMAIGSSRMLGIRLPMNFNSPLKATGIIDFWSRWHITFTRFVTSYMYVPIVMKLTRERLARGLPVLCGRESSVDAVSGLVAVPTLVTMMASGLWHGAGWQFVIWGLLHGIYLTINQSWKLWTSNSAISITRRRTTNYVGSFLTLLAVSVAIVFFRADSIASAVSILGGMIGAHGILPYYLRELPSLGASIPFWGVWEELSPYRWIFPLMLWVTVLPNSLELLQKYQPALDFRKPAVEPRDMTRLSRSLQLLRDLRERIRAGEIPANAFTVSLFVIVLVSGLLAIGQSSAFIYKQF